MLKIKSNTIPPAHVAWPAGKSNRVNVLDEATKQLDAYEPEESRNLKGLGRERVRVSTLQEKARRGREHDPVIRDIATPRRVRDRCPRLETCTCTNKSKV